MVTFERIKVMRHEHDKKQHFFASFILILILMPFVGWFPSLLITTLIGFSKEFWDAFYGSGFCWYDILANCFGKLAGLAVGMIVSVPLHFSQI